MLAKRLHTEIVNADSVQVYRGFDIGSAKPSAAELSEVPHHLISVVEPNDSFDAGKFRELAHRAIDDIHQRGLVPIISGGTGLYLRALLGGLVDVEISQSAVEEVQNRADCLRAAGKGEPEIEIELREWLAKLEPDVSPGSLPSDPQRVRRALHVVLSTGASLSRLQQEHKHGDRRFRALIFCLLPEREQLYQRIDRRVDQMVEAGFVDEVRSLAQRYPTSCKPFGAIGYRHLAAVVSGELALDEAIELLKRDTRRYSKRQLTWWRHQPRNLGWIMVDQQPDGLQRASQLEQIAERLAPEIEDFVQRRKTFSSDTVYFCPVENLNFG